MGFKFAGFTGFANVVLLCRLLPAQVAARPEVRVLVYNTSKLSAAQIELAGKDATRIFRVAGLPLAWVNCSGWSVPSECHLTPNSKQLVLHIIPKGKARTDFVYGVAFIGGDGRGRYASIFYDRLLVANREAGIDEVQLLAAVAAHEIGHLLLGLNAHSWSGIMAPMWNLETLHRIAMGLVYFNSDQALRIKEQIRNDVKVADVGGPTKRAGLILP